MRMWLRVASCVWWLSKLESERRWCRVAWLSEGYWPSDVWLEKSWQPIPRSDRMNWEMQNRFGLRADWDRLQFCGIHWSGSRSPWCILCILPNDFSAKGAQGCSFWSWSHNKSPADSRLRDFDCRDGRDRLRAARCDRQDLALHSSCTCISAYFWSSIKSFQHHGNAFPAELYPKSRLLIHWD